MRCAHGAALNSEKWTMALWCRLFMRGEGSRNDRIPAHVGTNDQADGVLPTQVFPCPVEQYHHAIPETHELEYMDEHPHQPGQGATETTTMDINNGLATADHRHTPLVLVDEQFSSFPFGPGDQVTHQQSTLLDGHGRNLRMTMWPLRVAGNDRTIAEHEDVRMPLQRIRTVHFVA